MCWNIAPFFNVDHKLITIQNHRLSSITSNVGILIVVPLIYFLTLRFIPHVLHETNKVPNYCSFLGKGISNEEFLLYLQTDNSTDLSKPIPVCPYVSSTFPFFYPTKQRRVCRWLRWEGVGGIFLCFDMPDVESSSRKPITMSTTKPRAPPSSLDNKMGKTGEKWRTVDARELTAPS